MSETRSSDGKPQSGVYIYVYTHSSIAMQFVVGTAIASYNAQFFAPSSRRNRHFSREVTTHSKLAR